MARLSDGKRMLEDLRMGRRITVFGTSHRLQGVENVTWAIDDPMYLVALKLCLRKKDFMFEEASGRSTAAQGFAAAQLGHGHYFDVDPPIEERQGLGIGQTELPTFIDPSVPDCFMVQQFFVEQEKREDYWLHRIQERAFANALFICGYLHTLSMSSRLCAAGYDVEAFYYLPHSKLCDKQHLG
jgi:hypothetical protein